MSGNGWCTHPDRQVSSDVRILVRKNELACRNAWGSDLWQDASSPESAATPPAGNQPTNTPPAPAPMNIAYDDEVTSVVSSDQHRSARNEALDDEVVDQSVINFRDDYADEEQEERRNLLYRGSGREVIQRARERAASKRQSPIEREVPAPETADDDDVIISEGTESRDEGAPSLKEPVFEPDDFVEDENPTAERVVDEHDDELLSEGIRTITPREARLRRFRDERPAPKEPETTKTEPAHDDVEMVLPPSAAPERGRFDSIPEISAEIDLPLLRRPSSAPSQPPAAPIQGADTPEDDSISYEQALKRARALNASARAEENASRRRNTPPMAPRKQAAPEPEPAVVMPDLPDDDEPAFMPEPTSAPAPSQTRKKAMNEPRPAPAARVTKPRLAATRQDHPRAPRTDDPRRSWWRGAKFAAEEEAAAEYADVSDVAPTLGSLPDHDVEPEPSAPLPMVNLNLERQEDLEAFRDRLFATSSPRESVDTGNEPVTRSPISVTRRQRPISPAARERYRAERAPRADQGERPSRRPVAPAPDVDDRPAPRAAQTRPEVAAAAREPRQLRPRERHIEADELLADPEDAWYEPMPEPDFDVRSLIDRDTELLDMTIEISPDVPRACRTCRNYRPSEQPGRGWCTNAWAFTHRQMVNETDIACDSTIGCWWLPADEEVWLTELDIASEATPRVDRLIAHLDPERRVVGS